MSQLCCCIQHCPGAERSLILQPNEPLVHGCIHGTREHRDNRGEAISIVTWINDSENCPNSCVQHRGDLQAARGSVPHANAVSSVQASVGSCREGRALRHSSTLSKRGSTKQPHVGQKGLMCSLTWPVTSRVRTKGGILHSIFVRIHFCLV